MRLWFINVMKIHHAKNMRNLSIHLGTDLEQEVQQKIILKANI